MRVAVSQSNYVPWLGYFRLMHDVDAFVVYDTVQYTKDDWRNRNVVLGPGGAQWLSIPVKTSGRFGQTILETEVQDGRWAAKHLKTLRHLYARAPGMKLYGTEIEHLYDVASTKTHIHGVNMLFIEWAMAVLGIETEVVQVQDLSVEGDRKERLIRICTQLGADTYVSAPAAKAYLSDRDFDGTGIRLEWYDYAHVPQYVGVNGSADRPASILDAIMSLGEDVRALMAT